MHNDRKLYRILGSLAGNVAVEFRYGCPASGCDSIFFKTEEMLIYEWIKLQVTVLTHLILMRTQTHQTYEADSK